MTKRGWLLCTVMFGVALASAALWARPRPRRPSVPVVAVEVPRDAGVFRVPFRLAEQLGFFRQEGIAVRLTTDPAALRLVPAGTAWPIIGVVGSRPDAFVVSSIDDPGFRLAWLAGVPLAYPRADGALAAWAKAVLALHGVSPAALDPLSSREIALLWATGHLPYLLADAATWLRLTPPPAPLRPAAALGASTGPAMTWVMAGRRQAAPQVLAALNLSLWYLQNHPPRAVARILKAPRSFQRVIAVAERYHFYAPSTYPTRPDYERTRRLAALLGRAWRPYDRAVDTRPAVSALALTP